MTMTSGQGGAPSPRWEQVLRVWRKGWAALQEQPLKLQEQLVERAFFTVGSLWMARRARRDPRLQLGENVRIQSPDMIRISGPDASVSIGRDGILYKGSEIVVREQGRIQIGTNCTFGQASLFAKSSIEIGDFALFSWGVHIQDYTPHPIDPMMRRRELTNLHEEFFPRFTRRPRAFVPAPEYAPPAPITIGDDVWLGAHVTVMPGVQIGRGCVVGTGSVVTRDLPPLSVAAGVPAKVIHELPTP